ncbi:head-tail adaptor protein [Anianabacter salinae]|uniref:head-tail adaptor protein n=1 Tax=Anianabacter salinae TaxID=2851023 RepID=UPI00225E00A3|nr:head-tail adaptor protein [Anianabacter salinae]MBV0912944.1 head-tail adaptor protein [Anianabacter salinae]
MTAPVLNRPMVLEDRVQLPDGAGGFSEGWQALGTVWVGVRPGAGRGGDVAGLAVGQVTHRLTCRAAPVGAPSRPRAGQRLREGARVFRILAVAEADGHQRYLVCTAREEVAA